MKKVCHDVRVESNGASLKQLERVSQTSSSLEGWGLRRGVTARRVGQGHRGAGAG